MITIISYDPLWKTMKKKGISQYKLINEGIDNKTLDSLKKGGNITMRTLENICGILDCNPNQVVKFVSENEKNDKSEG
ncbi:MAG: helix-turn-helix domain-containing protein [Oliverpabstia sp.]|nr:helix-turn-helix domain-containing protein [Oliverpabstia sp.]